MLWLSPFYRWGNKGLKDLVILRGWYSGRAGTRTQAVWPHCPGVPCWLYPATESHTHSHPGSVPSAHSLDSLHIQPQVTSCIFHHLLLAPFLVTLLPCDPRASCISFSLSHQPHSFETTSLNCLWHSGIWQLSFCSAFHLIQLFATASEFWNSPLCPCTLNFCFIKQGIGNLHFRACIYRTR